MVLDMNFSLEDYKRSVRQFSCPRRHGVNLYRHVKTHNMFKGVFYKSEKNHLTLSIILCQASCYCTRIHGYIHLYNNYTTSALLVKMQTRWPINSAFLKILFILLFYVQFNIAVYPFIPPHIRHSVTFIEMMLVCKGSAREQRQRVKAHITCRNSYSHVTWSQG